MYAKYTARIYNKDKIINEWTIEDRTDREADNEAEAEYRRSRYATDYTLTKCECAKCAGIPF